MQFLSSHLISVPYDFWCTELRCIFANWPTKAYQADFVLPWPLWCPGLASLCHKAFFVLVYFNLILCFLHNYVRTTLFSPLSGTGSIECAPVRVLYWLLQMSSTSRNRLTKAKYWREAERHMLPWPADAVQQNITKIDETLLVTYKLEMLRGQRLVWKKAAKCVRINKNLFW